MSIRLKKGINLLVAVSLICSSLTSLSASVQAKKTSYKIKNHQLINAKTNKVVTKTTVYKNVLYQKGKVAKGKVLYKNILYVNGKVKSGIVSYKEKLYKKGKVISKGTIFTYKEKLYKGQKLYSGLHKYKGLWYNNGNLAHGPIKTANGSKYYFFGKLEKIAVTDTKYIHQNGNETDVYIFFNFYAYETKISPKDIQLSGGTLKNASISTYYEADNSTEVICLTIEDLKPDTEYTVSFPKVSFFNVLFNMGSSTFKTTNALVLNNPDIQQFNDIYNQYKNLDYPQYTELDKGQKLALEKDAQKMQDLFDKIDHYTIETPYLKENNITDIKSYTKQCKQYLSRMELLYYQLTFFDGR